MMQTPISNRLAASLSLLLLLAMAVAFYTGRNSVQDANGLLDAGFTIVDPEGYECEAFDDGLYFTTKHKGEYVPAYVYHPTP